MPAIVVTESGMQIPFTAEAFELYLRKYAGSARMVRTNGPAEQWELELLAFPGTECERETCVVRSNSDQSTALRQLA